MFVCFLFDVETYRTKHLLASISGSSWLTFAVRQQLALEHWALVLTGSIGAIEQASQPKFNCDSACAACALH
jgi:hypothetical protein